VTGGYQAEKKLMEQMPELMPDHQAYATYRRNNYPGHI